MRNRVYEFARDYSQEFVEPGHVTNWLNAGARILAERTDTLRGEASGAVVGGNIPLPARFLKLQSLWLDGELIDPTTPKYFDEGGRFRVFGSNIVLKNVADGVSYTIQYFRHPVDMVADLDVSELPIDLHEKVVFYAISQALFKEREDALAAHYYDRFEEGLPPVTNAMFRDRPGPLDLNYDAGPFDVGASHRG